MSFQSVFRVAAAAGLCCSLSGCWIVSTTRHLPKPRTPDSIQTVSPDELVSRLNGRIKIVMPMPSLSNILPPKNNWRKKAPQPI